ncbi:hypothetical protein BCR39DRAFT_559542 [Naematelia encephala]|uniref:Uncharacterized protein n=1 Tax=Naematelia encephala TaxID=71784 RepID=A0A1Y2B0A6_9TREE|nr:hypothetical protein BCR39DRAFT_559542 [Naematelia encephala]
MKSLFRPFPLPLTGKQWFYLCFLQGVSAGFIDAGANFGIAYAMYHSQDVVKMWVFSQNTIAGDLGVTPIIQCAISMLISSTLVHTDLHHHAISPLPFVYPHVYDLPDPRSLFTRRRVMHDADEKPGEGETVPEAQAQAPYERNFKYYYWMLVRFIFEGTEKNMMLARIPISHWFGRLVWTGAQGAALGIVFGFPIWCLAIVILGPIYGNGNMGNKWAPQVIKLVYGAIVGWITNPVIAVLALGSQAEKHLMVIEVGEDEEAQIGGVETIQEDEEYLPPPPPTSPLRATSFVPSSPSRSTRLGIPSTPTRTRTHSGSIGSYSGRPPLTANVSSFAPPPPLVSPGMPSTTRSRSSTVPTRPARPRGATITSTAPSERSFSYTLGGTGGRAKRSRGLSSVSDSARQGDVPPLNLPLPSSSDENAARQGERTAVWDVFGKNQGTPRAPVMGRRQTTGGHPELGQPVGDSS